ncbi:MAG: lysophospholipid acyltransferase family protein [Pseudomonadota bacterium]|jgi:KDO2-lipid IV(A) lauroyltransferase
MLPILRFLSRLPLSVLHRLGALAGWAAYWGSPTYRRHLRENLALAFPAGVPRGLPAAAIAHAGRGLLELPALWLRPRERVVPLVRRVSGWEAVEAAWQAGKGIVFLTPHLGCFEITAQYYASHAPITVLYRPPKQGWLRPVMEQGRGGPNMHLAPADMAGVRMLMRALRRHQAVGILPDQVPGRGEGLWADFFDRPAYTMTLAARLAQTSGAAVILAYGERLPGGEGFHLHLGPPPEPIAGTLPERVAAINRALEALIRRCPEQYLWGYNRYKIPAGAAPARP